MWDNVLCPMCCDVYCLSNMIEWSVVDGRYRPPFIVQEGVVRYIKNLAASWISIEIGLTDPLLKTRRLVSIFTSGLSYKSRYATFTKILPLLRISIFSYLYHVGGSCSAMWAESFSIQVWVPWGESEFLVWVRRSHISTSWNVLWYP